MGYFKLVLQTCQRLPTEQVFIFKRCRTNVSLTIWWQLYGSVPPPHQSFQQCEYRYYSTSYIIMLTLALNLLVGPKSSCWHPNFTSSDSRLHDTEDSHIRLWIWIGSFHWSATRCHPSATSRCQPPEYDAIHQRCDSVTLWHAVSLA